MDETEHDRQGDVKLCVIADHGLCLRGSASGDLSDGFLSWRDLLVKTSSLFWEENRDDEDERYGLIRIIETVVIYYDVEWLS